MWIRLKNIGKIEGGFTPKESELSLEFGIPYFKISDMNTNGNEMFMKKTKLFYTGQKKGFKENSIIFPKNGGAVFTNKKRILCCESIVDLNTGVFSPSNKINFDFVLTLFKNIDFKKYYKGTALPTVDKETVENLYISIPPLEEQQRIVDKINSFEPLLEKYDKVEKELSRLEKEFPEKLKKSILQYAIEGKLVNQDPNDEPASVLLERIKQEKERLIKEGKIKRDKNESYIYQGDDKNYYEQIVDLPQGWVITTLSNISTLITKGTTPRGGHVSYLDSGIGFLRAENVLGYDKISKLDLKYISIETHLNYLKRSIIFEDDIIITIARTLGRTGLIKKEDLPLNTNQAIYIVRILNKHLTDLRYLTYILNSPSIQSNLTKQKKITVIPNLTLEIISNCIIPIAPVEQQKKIVNTLDYLFCLL